MGDVDRVDAADVDDPRGSSAVPTCRSAGSSACTSQNGDLRLRSITLSQAASGNLASGSPHVAPALLTRMSSPRSRR